MKYLKKLLIAFIFTVLVSAFALAYSASAEKVTYPVDGGYIYFDTESREILSGTSGIKDLIIPSKIEEIKVTGIAANAFANSDIESLVLPDTITHIGSLAFMSCENLSSVQLSSKLTELYDTFWDCKSLKSITIPSGIRTLGAAFMGCTSLETVTLGSGLQDISSCAFAQTAIKSITLPSTVRTVAYDAFEETPLEEITVDSNNTTFASNDGILFSKDMKTLVMYPAGRADTVYTIPQNVLGLSDHAFYYLFNLKALVVSPTFASFDLDDFSSSIDTVYYTCTQEEWQASGHGTFPAHIKNHIYGYPCSVDGHNWSEWIETTVPTCSVTGSEYRSCTACKTTETREIVTLPHLFGEWIVITPPTETAVGSQIHVCSVCSFSEFGEIPKLEKKFIDLQDGKWYTEAIYYCYDNDYMTGISDNTFGYNEAVTRAMFVTILAKINGAELSEYTEMSFVDVKADQWYSASIEWAYQNGYASGIGDGVFGYKQNVTREQIAMFLYTYSEKNGVDVSGRAEISGFIDYDRIHEYALDAMSWAVDAKLISGTSETTLSPRDNATRAEIALIVMNYVNITKQIFW